VVVVFATRVLRGVRARRPGHRRRAKRLICEESDSTGDVIADDEGADAGGFSVGPSPPVGPSAN